MSCYFGLPQYGMFCLTPYMESVCALVVAMERAGFPYRMHFGSDSAVHRARYFITEAFMKSDCDRLMFIDSDIGFSAEDFGKLWAMDCDIAVGAYAMKQDTVPGLRQRAWFKPNRMKVVEIKTSKDDPNGYKKVNGEIRKLQDVHWISDEKDFTDPNSDFFKYFENGAKR